MCNMFEIRYVQYSDITSWFCLDKHLSEKEFEKKVRDKQGYVLLVDEQCVGILRYNLFWDSIPFCTMLFLDEEYRKQGYGTRLLSYWENDMRSNGHDMVLVSTQVNETAQHFYREAGYRDCGCLCLDEGKHAQPMEMFMMKVI